MGEEVRSLSKRLRLRVDGVSSGGRRMRRRRIVGSKLTHRLIRVAQLDLIGEHQIVSVEELRSIIGVHLFVHIIDGEHVIRIIVVVVDRCRVGVIIRGSSGEGRVDHLGSDDQRELALGIEAKAAHDAGPAEAGAVTEGQRS